MAAKWHPAPAEGSTGRVRVNGRFVRGGVTAADATPEDVASRLGVPMATLSVAWNNGGLSTPIEVKRHNRRRYR